MSNSLSDPDSPGSRKPLLDAGSRKNKLNVRDFVDHLSYKKADENPERWEGSESPDLRRDLVAAVNVHGLPGAGVPGILAAIEKLVRNGAICIRSVSNDIPALDPSDVSTRPEKFWMTYDDALVARAYLCPPESPARDPSGVGPVTIYVPREQTLLNVEWFIQKVAEYLTPSEEESEFGREIDATRMRHDIAEASHLAILTLRTGTGAVCFRHPGKWEPMSDFFVQRRDFERFAFDTWTVEIADAPGKVASDSDLSAIDILRTVRNGLSENGKHLEPVCFDGSEHNIEDLSNNFPIEPLESASGTLKLPSGIDTKTIAIAFDAVYWNEEQWLRNLADPPKWLQPARMSKGARRPGGSATWNPVTVAARLADRNIPISRLDVVFTKRALKTWGVEWEEKSQLLRL